MCSIQEHKKSGIGQMNRMFSKFQIKKQTFYRAHYQTLKNSVNYAVTQRTT
jgi:hypothetical protein